MKRNFLPILFIIALALPGCARENPLSKADLEKLTYWVYQHRTAAIEACGETWAQKPTASPAALKSCEAVAEELAKLLGKEGYGDITPEDVPLPDLWISFNARIASARANRYDAGKAGNAFQLNDPKLEAGRDKEKEYRKSKGLK